MASLPRLYVDVDGVLAFQPEGSIIATNAKFGTSHLAAEARVYPWTGTLPANQQAWLRINRTVICANLAPDMPAIKTVRKAAKAGYDVTIATEREPSVGAVTKAWLDYWGVPYDELTVVGPGNKPDLIRSGSGRDRILIDDDPAKEQLAGDGVQVWVPPRPWTPAGDAPAGVWRFDRWGQVRKRLGL
jgi:uncharacterized HAD superfamily protein